MPDLHGDFPIWKATPALIRYLGVVWLNNFAQKCETVSAYIGTPLSPVRYPSRSSRESLAPHLRAVPMGKTRQMATRLFARQRRGYTSTRGETRAMTRSQARERSAARGPFQMVFLLLLGLPVLVALTVPSLTLAQSSSLYPYSSNSLDWSSSKSDSPYYDDHKPGYQNSNAGYLGSDLPPSEYQPDARSKEYQREKTAPLPPLDNGQYSGKHNPYCTNRPLCGGGD